MRNSPIRHSQFRDFPSLDSSACPSNPSSSSADPACRFALIQPTIASPCSSHRVLFRTRNRSIASTTLSRRRCPSRSAAAAPPASTDPARDSSGTNCRATNDSTARSVDSCSRRFRFRFLAKLRVSCRFVVLAPFRVPHRTIADNDAARRKLQPGALILWKFAWSVLVVSVRGCGSCCDVVDLEWTMSK